MYVDHVMAKESAAQMLAKRRGGGESTVRLFVPRAAPRTLYRTFYEHYRPWRSAPISSEVARGVGDIVLFKEVIRVELKMVTLGGPFWGVGSIRG